MELPEVIIEPRLAVGWLINAPHRSQGIDAKACDAAAVHAHCWHAQQLHADSASGSIRPGLLQSDVLEITLGSLSYSYIHCRWHQLQCVP